jgi:hypothetical protein
MWTRNPDPRSHVYAWASVDRVYVERGGHTRDGFRLYVVFGLFSHMFAIYKYDRLSQGDLDEWNRADSKGKAAHRHLRTFPFSQIERDALPADLRLAFEAMTQQPAADTNSPAQEIH